MGIRSAMIAAVMAMFLLLHPAVAQPLLAGGAVSDQVTAQEAAPAGGFTLSHSALKAITYKAATTASNLTILSVAAGGVAAGAALTAFGAAASLVVYAVNDYAWDTHAPPPPPKPDDSRTFNLNDEFWRTSKKFMTYKAATLWIKAVKMAAVYAYTGSATTTLTAVSAATVINGGIFFANNFAWDYYDWLAVSPPASLPPPPETLPAPPNEPLPVTAALLEAPPKS